MVAVIQSGSTRSAAPANELLHSDASGQDDRPSDLLDRATRRTRCLKERRPPAVSCRTRRGLLVSRHRGWLADVLGFMGDSSGAAFYSALMELLQPMFPHANLMPPHPAHSYQTWTRDPLPLSLASPYAPAPATPHAAPRLRLPAALLGSLHVHLPSRPRQPGQHPVLATTQHDAGDR